jgi:hypothetical protein
MANQIVVSAGAKVRNLGGVLTATSGVVSSVPLGAANGVATLDSGGKVPVSQLPSSVVTYLGTWNAATNFPTLVNGTGDAGDMYLCNVAGTVNFGAGPVTFAVGDWVLYGSGTWQKSNGQNGTVTSVAITESGDSLNITGSPITTSGTINIGFNGTNLQYVNGAGNLTTFPILTGYVPYTGATADVDLGNFSATGNTSNFRNSYINGTASVQGQLMIKQAVLGSTNYAGYSSIYSTGSNITVISDVAGTTYKSAILSFGSLTNNTDRTYAFPNASGTIALTSDIPILTGYVPYTGATANVDLGTFNLTADVITGATGSFASNGGSDTFAINHSSGAGIALNITKGGNGEGLYINKTSGSGNAATIIGTLNATTLVKSGGTSSQFLKADGTVDSSTYALDSAVVHNTGNETVGGTKTFSDATKNNGGIFLQNGSSNALAGYMNLGGLTNGVKFTSGGGISNTFTLPSATGYTFTFPNATGTIALTSDISYPVTSVFGRTGAVVATEGDYSLTQLSDVTITTPSTGQVLKYNGTAWVNDTDANTGTVTSVAALTIGTSGTDLSSSVANSTTTPVITLNVPTASAANRGALSSADWTTFNNKQSALTNPVTGTGTTNYLPKFTGASTIGNSLVYDDGTRVFINATTAPAFGSPKFFVKMATANSYEGILVASSSNNNAVAIAHTGSIGLITTNYGTGGTNTPLGFGTGGATQMTLDTSGNLGLGVTPSAWDLTGILQNAGGSLWNTSSIVGVNQNAYFGGSTWKYVSSAAVSDYYQTGGQHIWRNAPSGTAGNAITFTQAMTLTAAGRLLIGTPTEASYMLDVNGTGRFSGAATFSSSVTAGAEYAYYWQRTSGGSNLWSLSANSAAAYIFNHTTASSVMTILNGGNVGIGTSNPLYRLVVSNNGAEGLEIGTGYVSNKTLIQAYNRSGATYNQLDFAATAFSFNNSVTATSFFESSSIKGKDIIATNPLLALDIDVIKYTRKSDESKDIRYGYSAEQIHSLMPELTDKDVTAVKYLDVHTILISQLQQEIKELKAKMN